MKQILMGLKNRIISRRLNRNIYLPNIINKIFISKIKQNKKRKIRKNKIIIIKG